MPIDINFSTACSHRLLSICQVGNCLYYNHQGFFFLIGLVFKITLTVIFNIVENFMLFCLLSVFKLLFQISYLNTIVCYEAQKNLNQYWKDIKYCFHVGIQSNSSYPQSIYLYTMSLNQVWQLYFQIYRNNSPEGTLHRVHDH